MEKEKNYREKTMEWDPPPNTRTDGGKFIIMLLLEKGCIYQLLVQYVVIRNYIAIILW